MDMRRRFDAILYDLDGTLIDSMPLHNAAWARWFAQQGVALAADPDFFAKSAGRSHEEILADLFPQSTPEQRAAWGDEKDALYREAARAQLQLVPGAMAWLDAGLAEGVQQAVCTAAPLANIALADARFGLKRRVQALTSPSDGLRGKPHPDLFLKAAERLGVRPERCLVVEDAPLGIEAAARAGMQAIALTTSMPASGFAGMPALIASAPNFLELDRLGLLMQPSAAL